MQIRETVAPEVLFGADYPYYSSISDALLSHFRGNVETVGARKALDARSLVIEIASNDGYLLQNYVKRGVPVLGIDPASGPVREARRKGIETLDTFFTLDLARELAASGRTGDVVHANNVLAHVADTNGFVAGIATILKDDGLAVIECPYVRELVDHCEFDTIYHQHLCYFSVHALDRLFRRHGLYLNDVQALNIHGGSLRLFVGKRPQPGGALAEFLAEERRIGLDRVDYYRNFAARVSGVRRKLRDLLDRLKREGRTIAGYGAAAKACTLMAYVGIDGRDLACIVDRSEFKQGKLYPGNRLPIRHPDWLLEHQPDFALLLSWNFAEEIMRQQAEYRRRGGRFIIPIPEPVIQ
jgi:SAM-dependent methyltransferase